MKNKKSTDQTELFAWVVVFLMVMIAYCTNVQAQTVIPSFQRNLMTHESSYALTAGMISDINGSTFTAGPILKQYGKHIKPGLRIQVQIPINDLVYFETIADSFYQRNTFYESKFLEIGAGLGVQHRNIQLTALYQSADSNPVTKSNKEDLVVLKGGWRIVWNR